ncbi:hypothetical protein CY34DRAFT_244816 [Suillus luteus UH-Slu-Lm8-n1]|uniref:Uncharacterized protein n=1 Tax=Suillus luteus UH-Slu-Lm8-n1 TaxID=930992 RepID=A0A0D0BB71_9AGAM|nr:hypothetical protein CY34DRAFT_244816 [Suillus luteus UH-Slu-Lm8-n1]
MQPRSLTALSFHGVIKRHLSPTFFSCGVSPPHPDMMYDGSTLSRGCTALKPDHDKRRFSRFLSSSPLPLCAASVVNTMVSSLVADGVLWGDIKCCRVPKLAQYMSFTCSNISDSFLTAQYR